MPNKKDAIAIVLIEIFFTDDLIFSGYLPSTQYCSDKQGRQGKQGKQGRQNSSPASISPPAPPACLNQEIP
ncbi:MAG: hypothetical protein V7L23_18875 [Nostoc sp.]|uniref:hypothetical protein n=1 Tax=Nostoc sp. TaxID=1180 RepID=UPI002FF0241D